MSLFSALTVAVGGLNAQSKSVGHISDNISNASTVGFKRIDTEFQSLVTQSNAPINDPGGVRARPYYQNDIQGNLVQSQNATSLAVAGKGFFNVKAPSVSTSGDVTFSGEVLYTRRGDFRIDKDGYMVNGAGLVLSGYSIDSDGNIAAEVEPIQISQLSDQPVATSTVTYRANLPASSPVPPDAVDFNASTVQVFDALGAKHSLSFDWSKTATNTWRLTTTLADAEVSSTDSTAIASRSIDFTFNAGTSTIPAGTINTVANVSPSTFFTLPTDTSSGKPVQISFDAFFPGAGTQTIALDFGKFDLAAGLTQFDATTLNVSSIEQNGIPQGSFRDLEIDDVGHISLNYDNGRSRTLYQIPLVQFNSTNNLQREEGGAYSSSIASGTAKISLAGSNGSGKIVGNTLEGSNVDIADEFTKMIQAQRIYSANARTITTANSMLEEVINVVR